MSDIICSRNGCEFSRSTKEDVSLCPLHEMGKENLGELVYFGGWES